MAACSCRCPSIGRPRPARRAARPSAARARTAGTGEPGAAVGRSRAPDGRCQSWADRGTRRADARFRPRRRRRSRREAYSLAAVTCPNCATQNLPDAKFCIQCGFRLACPTCSAPIVVGARFCSNCGTRLAGEDAPGADYPPVPNAPYGTTSGVAPATERRVVTVLFADLVGFTTLSSTRDPETIRELQSLYFERSREIVHRYGGVVEKRSEEHT